MLESQSRAQRLRF